MEKTLTQKQKEKALAKEAQKVRPYEKQLQAQIRVMDYLFARFKY